ncbi:MAG: hypothetical protein HFI33_15365 [Lachnospiraceae bacterium]|nr:hypothetical protein [Lachnospiraceae bacterium]
MAVKDSGLEKSKVETVQEDKKAVKQAEPVYTAEELANAAKELFGTRRECVLAALRESGIQSCTRSVAKKLVEAYRKKEVK